MQITFQNKTYHLTDSQLRTKDLQELLEFWQTRESSISLYNSSELCIICLQKSPQKAYKYCRNDYDRGRFLFARQYLIDHISLPPSIEELARIAGLNSFKLKNGFKELFGEPIYKYLNTFRMEKAKWLILGGEKNMTQIAFELGFSSLQHFSAAFKKAHGCSPKKIKTAVEHPKNL